MLFLKDYSKCIYLFITHSTGLSALYYRKLIFIAAPRKYYIIHSCRLKNIKLNEAQMIAFPSGTVIVKKVDGNDNFIEDSLDYFDLQASLSANLVTITGSQTVSGQKTFTQPILASELQSISGSLDLKASGTNDINFYNGDDLHASLDSQGILMLKSHTAFSGSGHMTVTSGIQTTNNTNANILTLALEDNSAYWIEIYAIGRRVDAAPLRIRMEHNQACAYREGGGSATLVGTVNNVLSRSLSAGGYDVAAGVSGNDFNITVNGDAAETVNWVCSVRYQRVSLNT